MKIDTFSLKSPQTTASAWVEIYVNNGTLAPNFYADLMFITGLDGTGINDLLFKSDSPMQVWMKANLFDMVFNDYKATCSQTTTFKTACSKKDLAYQQWLDKSIFTGDSLPPYVKSQPDSYVNAYRRMSGLPNPIELGHFNEKAGKAKTTLTVV